LSGGTVSVSFAAIQYIKENVADLSAKKILLVGAGKIGRNTCKNVVDYLHTTNITVINRSCDKAAALAQELGLQTASMDELVTQIQTADVIIVATNAAAPILFRSQLEAASPKTIIDLSIPYNVELATQELSHITLVNVDDLSKIKDETLHKRTAEIPKANIIIAAHLQELMDWHEMRKNVPVLKAVKNKLESMQSCSLYHSYSLANFSSTATPVITEEKIQKVITTTAIKMRRQNQGGCNFIEAINDFMAVAIN